MAIPSSTRDDVEMSSQSSDSQDVSPVMAELLAWSTHLPLWKRDALRRLVSQTQVSDREIDELTRACLADAEALDDGEKPPELEALDCKHVPKTTVDSASVAIQAIGNVENTNALAEEQELAFSPVGISVVYGDNGSGKSGYARILKRAGRSRGRDEPIRCNVYENEPGKPATATVDFLVGESARSIKWSDGDKPDDLASVSCFDSDFATFHVNEKNLIDFTPFGLHLFSGLVDVCKRVKVRIASRAAAISRPASALVENPACAEETKVGKAIQELSSKSSLAKLAETCHVEKSDLDRANRLEALLKKDPEIEAKAIQHQVKRIDGLLSNLQAVERHLSADAICQIIELAQDANTKRQAAEIAGKQIVGIPLDGVGTSPWAELWKTARLYSEIAYPGDAFPVTHEGAACVLCQQELSEDAATRLRSFDAFVKDQTEAAAKKSKKALDLAIGSVKQLNLLPETWSPQYSELFEDDLQIERSINEAIKNASAIQAEMLAQADFAKVGLKGWPNDSREKIEGHRNKLIQKQQQLLASVDPKQTASLRLELREIRDRQWLNDNLEDFLSEIDRLATLDRYKKAERLASHRTITEKGGKLAEKHITEELTSRFSREVRRLCGRDVKVSVVKGRSTDGVPSYQLKLDTQQKVKPGLVLSEGEFRCIAIAGFISELETSENRSAIILDDPVSSLGHQWRSQIAKRLVEVAADRQVIVLTHDIFFVTELKRFAGSAKIPIHTNHLARSANSVGLCKPDLPWFGATVRQRITVLRDRLADLAGEYNSATWERKTEITENFYGDMRETIERCVEREFVGGCVKRFSNYVQVSKLWMASVFDDKDADALHELFRICSPKIKGHDQSTSGCVSPPEHSDMIALVDQLEAVLDTVAKKRNALKQKRQRFKPSSPKPPFEPNF